MANKIEEIIEAVEKILSNKKRRHLIGGALISMSIMLSGFAITTLTMKMEEIEDE